MASDLHEAATEAAGLALKIASAVPDGISFKVDVGDDFPLIHIVLKTLKTIRATLGTLESNRDALGALHKRCACITACTIVKCRRSSPSEVDIRPLVASIAEVGKLMDGYSRRGWISRLLKAYSDKNEIANLHERIGELAHDMGLVGILAIELEVDELNGLLETTGTKQDETPTCLPKPPTKLAKVPKGAPAGKSWHVRRDHVMDTVCESLSRDGGPHLVGLVGGSGSGKTTAASELVRDNKVREVFADGIVWISVGEGAKESLPALALELARLVYEDIGGSLGQHPPAISEDCAAYTRGYMDGHHDGAQKRCLLVADNVYEQEVVVELLATGMCVLLTTRHNCLVGDNGGKAVVVDELSEEDAEAVLLRASELPHEAHLPEAAKELTKLCGRVAMDLAFVGRWGTLRGKTDSFAWSDAVAMINAELAVDVTSGSEEGGRAKDRRAVLCAGFENLAFCTDDDRIRLYLALAVLPDGHRFSAGDAVILLYGRTRSSESEEKVEDVVATLESWAILRSDDGKYRMHHAHSSFARESLMNREHVRRPAIERWVDHLSRLETLRSLDTATMMALWWAVKRVGEDGWRKRRPYAEEVAELDDSDPLCRESLLAVARVRGAKGDLAGEKDMYRRLLRVEQYTLGLHDPNVANTLCHLGNCAERRGKPNETRKWRQREYEAVLTVLSKIRADRGVGESEQSAADGLWSFASGTLRVAPRRLDEAEKLLRRVVEIDEARLGPENVQVANTLHQLGVCMREAGRKLEAQEVLRRALHIKEAKLGPTNVYVAVTLHELAVCLRETGQLEEAGALLRRALDIWNGKLGLASGCITRTLSELNMCLRKDGGQLYCRVRRFFPSVGLSNASNPGALTFLLVVAAVLLKFVTAHVVSFVYE